MNYQILLKEHIEKSVPVAVVFGSPRNRCLGVGICEINGNGISTGRADFSCKPVQVNFLMTYSKQLGILIPPAALSEASVKRQLSGVFFEIEENFALPKFITDGFGLAGGHFLPSGLYSINHVASSVLILF